MIFKCFRHRSKARLSRLGESGQAIVESALVMPLLATILLGSAELARVAYTAIQVSNAAKAGVQYGTSGSGAGCNVSDTTGIQNAAISDAANLTGLAATPSISCICSDGSASTCQPGDCSNSHSETILTVNTQATFDPVIHLPGLPTTFTLRGQAIRKC